MLCRILCELTAQRCKNFAECLLDVIFSKPDLLDTLDVGELISSVFQQDECPIKAKPPLKQSRFVDHVLPSSGASIGRLARKGEIRRETRKRPGVRPSPVYSPEDLNRVKNAQTPQVAVLPPQAEAGGVPALVPRVELPSFLQSLLSGADVPLRDKLFLSVKEAVRFSGLPESTIRCLLRSGKLPGVKAGGWRIRRGDLEELGCRQIADLSDARL